MEKKRSVGVTILGTCLLFCVIPGLAAAFIGAISGPPPKHVFGTVLDIMMRILFILSPAMFLVAGVGLLRLKNWARLLTIFLSPALAYIGVGFTGMFLISLIPDNRWTFVFFLSVIMAVLSILFYLTRPKVKEQFKPGGPNA